MSSAELASTGYFSRKVSAAGTKTKIPPLFGTRFPSLLHYNSPTYQWHSANSRCRTHQLHTVLPTNVAIHHSARISYGTARVGTEESSNSSALQNNTRGPFYFKDHRSRHRNSITKIWQWWHCLIVILGISLQVRCHLYIELSPSPFQYIKTVFTGIVILIIRVKLSWDHLIFITGITILIRQFFFISNRTLGSMRWWHCI